MLFEIKFAEWIADYHWTCCDEHDFIYYWCSEIKGMSQVPTDLLFDMFLDEKIR